MGGSSGDAAPATSESRDGLWRVETPTLCAGFVVRDGRVISCAPILRRRFAYWWTRAVRVEP